jgi:hypothetical protein
MEPGEGAIKYAASLVDALSREEAAKVITSVLEGLPPDRRVKLCDFCKYPFRDESLRNTRGTCCDGCKRGLKTLQRRKQRADKDLLSPKPKKSTKREQNYYWWFEYPFWLDEYEMLKQSWKYEVPHDMALLDHVTSQNQLYGPGNRKVKSRTPGYEDEKAGQAFNAATRAKLRGF